MRCTANNFAAEVLLILSTSNCQLYDNCNSNRAWSNVSTVMISVEKSGPSASRIAYTDRFGVVGSIGGGVGGGGGGGGVCGWVGGVGRGGIR